MTEYSVEEVRKSAAFLRLAYPDEREAASMLTAYADLLERIKADEGEVLSRYIPCECKGGDDERETGYIHGWNSCRSDVIRRVFGDPPAQAAQGEVVAVQFWLAELDQYGNPKLTDGAHPDRDGAEKAATIIRRLGLDRESRFAVAEIHLSELTGEHGPLDEGSIATLNAIGLRPEPTTGATPPAQPAERVVDVDIKAAVTRFLGWRLPSDFRPDCYISFDPEPLKQWPGMWPVGTNLLDADQAEAMLRYVLDTPPDARVARVPDTDDLSQLRDAVADWDDDRDTEVPHHVLMRLVEVGLLEADRFILTKKGQDALATASPEKLLTAAQEADR